MHWLCGFKEGNLSYRDWLCVEMQKPRLQLVAERKCFSTTFELQALAFYERHGYRVFATLEDFPSGFTRYYLVKEIAECMNAEST